MEEECSKRSSVDFICIVLSLSGFEGPYLPGTCIFENRDLAVHSISKVKKHLGNR